MKKLKAIIVLVLLVVSVAILCLCFPPIAPFLIPVALAGGSMLLKPIREKVENALHPQVPPISACRVYMFGIRGSGKTTIIKSLLSTERLEHQNPTTDFETYRAQIIVNLEGWKTVDIWFADYQGEKPSQVVSDPPIDFLGSRENPLVNALFFVVDLVPRLFTPDGKVVDDDDQMLAWLQEDFEERIRERIAEHHGYISKWAIEMIFGLLVGRHLKCVFLIFNKMDLMEKAYDNAMTRSDLQKMFREQFFQIESNIQAACAANSVPHFEVTFVSARKDSAMKDVVNKVIDCYSR